MAAEARGLAGSPLLRPGGGGARAGIAMGAGGEGAGASAL